MDNIAIIGMGCLYPDYVNKENFWDRMMRGEAFTSTDYFNGREIERATVPKERSEAFFRNYFSGQEYSEMDVLGEVYKWTTYICKDALQESGYLGNKDIMKRTGLVYGVFGMPAAEYVPFFDKLVQASGTSVQVQALLGKKDYAIKIDRENPYTTKALLADTEPSNYVTEKFGLGGPVLNINTACSTPIYAMKLAIMYLQQGKVDMMLAGAQCYNQLNAAISGLFDVLGILSAPGENKPFDKNSKGVIGGSGAGMFALKRLKDAQRDGDTILGVIESIGWSNDGGKKAILAPDAGGQILAYEDAYRGVLSPDIDYIECHATGTVVGDWTEIDSITHFFRKQGADPMLGALKGNTGHFFTASSHAAVAKVLLSMKNNQIPQTIRITDPIDKRIVLKNTDWIKKGEVKRAAVNSFGFGGTNSHLVLREYVKEYEENLTAKGVEGDKSKAIAVEKPFQEYDTKMAVVGMGMQIGEMESVQDYYKSLLHKKPAVKKPHKIRWHQQQEDPKFLDTIDLPKMPDGAYIYDFDFDFMEYKFPALGDEYLLRKDYLLLKVAAQAIRDAGIEKGTHPKTAVVINSGMDYSEMNFTSSLELKDSISEQVRADWPEMTDEQIEGMFKIFRDKEKVRETPNSVAGMMPNIRASRIAAQWEFHGPALSVLDRQIGIAKTLEVAQYLLSEKIVEQVVVGCIELIGELEHVYVQKLLNNMDLINQYGVGEGAVVFVLKRSDAAQKDNDRIHAVIDAVSICEPDADARQQMKKGLSAVIQKGKTTPGDIGYIEMPVTAPAEKKEAIADLLKQDFSAYVDTKDLVQDAVEQYCGIGFSLTAAIAMAKSALQLSNAIKFNEHENKQVTWSLQGTNRSALINAFNENGSTAHILLSEYKDEKQTAHKLSSDKIIIPIFADNMAGLQSELKAFAESLKSNGTLALAEKYWSKYKKASSDAFVLCLTAQDKDSFKKEAQQAKEGISTAFKKGSFWESENGSYFTVKRIAEDAKIVYMFPPGEMSNSSHFYENLNCFADLKQYYLDFIDADFIAKSDIKGQYLETYAMQLVESKFGVDVVQKKMNLFPDMIAASSMGELTCLFATDSVTYDSKHDLHSLYGELVKVLERLFAVNPLEEEYLDQKIQSWETWFVKGHKDELLDLVEKETTVFAAIIGSPQDVIICGEGAACKRVLQKFSGFGTQIKDSTVIHTPIAEKIYNTTGADEFSKKIHLRKDLEYTVYNTHTLDVLSADKKDALSENFHQIVTNTVDFNRVIEKSYDNGGRIYIDLSTNEICTSWATTILEGKEKFIFSPYSQIHKPEEHYLRLFAKLISVGVQVNTQQYYSMFEYHISDKPKFVRNVKMSIQDFIDLIGKDADKNLEQVMNLEPKQEQAEQINTQLPDPKKDASISEKPVKKQQSTEQTSASLSTQSIKKNSGTLPAFAIKTLKDNARAYALYVESENTILDHLLQSKENSQSFSISSTAQVQKALVPSLQSKPMMAESPKQINQPVSKSEQKEKPVHIESANKQEQTIQASSYKELSEKPYEAVTSKKCNNLPTKIDAAGKECIWDLDDIIEMSSKSMASVLGPRYKAADQYPVRARLPLPPFLFITRITKIDAEYGKFRPSSIEIEYDITEDCILATGNQVSNIVMTESAQIGIFLVGYMGIDEMSKGTLRFRIVDTDGRMHNDMPGIGETFRGVYTIKSFFKMGSTTLINATYECYVGDKHIISLKSLGGFFTDKDLASTKGVLEGKAIRKRIPRVDENRDKMPIPIKKSSFSTEELKDFYDGKYYKYVPGIDQEIWEKRFQEAISFSPKVQLLDRITNISNEGGKYGMGEIVGERDIDEDFWAFDVHFINDPVYPGSLILEGINQLGLFTLLHTGLITRASKLGVFPLKGLLLKSKFRSQIRRQKSTLTYKMSIKDVHDEKDRFYMIFDGDIYCDGHNVCSAENLSLCIE